MEGRLVSVSVQIAMEEIVSLDIHFSVGMHGKRHSMLF
jgi:hypothetical protein